MRSSVRSRLAPPEPGRRRLSAVLREKRASRSALKARRGLSDIVKRKYIRSRDRGSRAFQARLSGLFEHLSRGRGLTAALSGVFEAKLVFSANAAAFVLRDRAFRCRAMGVGNESDQVS